MIALRRRTREARRHERATVLQQLGAQSDDPRAWQAQRDLEVSRMRRAHRANGKGGGRHAPGQDLGLVTNPQGAGGTRSPEACKYCGVVGGHTGQCPVVS